MYLFPPEPDTDTDHTELLTGLTIVSGFMMALVLFMVCGAIFLWIRVKFCRHRRQSYDSQLEGIEIEIIRLPDELYAID